MATDIMSMVRQHTSPLTVLTIVYYGIPKLGHRHNEHSQARHITVNSDVYYGIPKLR